MGRKLCCEHPPERLPCQHEAFQPEHSAHIVVVQHHIVHRAHLAELVKIVIAGSHRSIDAVVLGESLQERIGRRHAVRRMQINQRRPRPAEDHLGCETRGEFVIFGIKCAAHRMSFRFVRRNEK